MTDLVTHLRKANHHEQLKEVFLEVVRALEALPDDEARRRVLEAVMAFYGLEGVE